MTSIATPLPSPLPRRGLQGFLGAILAGVAAGGFAWVALGSGMNNILLMGFILLVPVPLFMAGLGIGRSDAIVATLVAAAAMTVSVGAENMLILLIVYLCPVLLLCLLATRYRHDEKGHLYWYPTGRLLVLLVLYPVFVYMLVSFLAGAGGIENVIRNGVTTVVDAAFLEEGAAQLNTPEMKLFTVNKVTALLPMSIITGWIFAIVTTGLWTQIALAGNKMALRPLPSLTDIELPISFLVLLAIMGLLAGFYSGQVAYFARSVLMPLTLPYVLVGIGLVHLWARRRKHKIMWLLAFYILLFFQWPGIFVAAIGVLEPWLHLRARISGPKVMSKP